MISLKNTFFFPKKLEIFKIKILRSTPNFVTPSEAIFWRWFCIWRGIRRRVAEEKHQNNIAPWTCGHETSASCPIQSNPIQAKPSQTKIQTKSKGISKIPKPKPNPNPNPSQAKPKIKWIGATIRYVRPLMPRRPSCTHRNFNVFGNRAQLCCLAVYIPLDEAISFFKGGYSRGGPDVRSLRKPEWKAFPKEIEWKILFFVSKISRNFGDYNNRRYI